MERQVILHTDPEDGGWVAEVPGLPGCISQGDTKEEALRNVREAMALWLEAAGEEDFRVPAEDVQIEIQRISVSGHKKTTAR
jgi:antitoxin HicB